MARIHYFQYILDNQGNPLTDAEVRIYLSDSSVEANIYVHPNRGTQTTSSVANIKTDEQGFFAVWFGDSYEKNGGYGPKQKFKVTWTKGVFTNTINNLTIYAPLFPVDETDYYDATLNKTISNFLAKKLENHVESIVPISAPHNIVPYNAATDLYYYNDVLCNKVISNRLAYQMWQISDLVFSETLSIDTSAARYHLEYSPTLTPSGGIYYADIIHNFVNEYPLVVVIENKRIVMPEDVVSIDENTIRIFLETNLNIDVVVIG